MRYRYIPGTPLNAAVICMGTAGFGGGMPREDAFKLFDLYVEQGGNFIDTALVYDDWLGQGRSLTEIRIGEWLKERGHRDQLILATKGAHPELATMHIPRLGRADIEADIDRSLRQLQTDYIDLYWLHRDDANVPVDEIMETLHDEVKAGRIRSIGCSNWTVERIKQAQRYAAEHGLTPFAASQPLWNLAVCTPGSVGDPTLVVMSDSDRTYFAETGMAVIPYSSQANGFFSGRYARDREAGSQGSAAGVQKMYFNEASFDRLERVQQLAAELETTSTVIALSYLTSQPFPVFPIIGASKPAYVLDSCAASEVTLTPAQLRFLETGSYVSAV
ncbi:aldo/keto reductase [Paenibacillus lignilyticus]|uniref:Aldo/keto reductase n=1 Tax=Paenibacillus lignilyticus TaxID=1172615 RepID=A0ABS5CJX9_9BACL|nr:aldo/keto reductase [Paenibacillus lignilyticus]MBP3966127.1 aldo/keto reductase [Paenibacillus lignilyticus]